jgi:hypothetical protein
MTKGPIQAAHPAVAHNFEAEKGFTFADGVQNVTGKFPEGLEAQLPSR